MLSGGGEEAELGSAMDQVKVRTVRGWLAEVPGGGREGDDESGEQEKRES